MMIMVMMMMVKTTVKHTEEQTLRFHAKTCSLAVPNFSADPFIFKVFLNPQPSA
jgi:uncharacterized protein involved in response to NO